MNVIRKTVFALGISAAALTGLVLTAPAPATAGVPEIRLQGALIGTVNGVTAKGQAKYRDRGSRSFSTQIEDVNAANGTVFNVVVKHGLTDYAMGTITLNLRRGELDLNTNDGETVPQLSPSDLVLVQYQGNTVMTGVLN